MLPFSVRILMYHSVAVNPNDPHAVTPDDFARQMDSLAAQQIAVIDLVDAVSRLDHWSAKPCVVITFDDALRDFLTNAAPILKAHHFSATMFVPTGFVGGNAAWDSYDKNKPLLTWDELTTIQQMGFSIGSHSVTHPRLTACSADQLQAELRDSLVTLRARLPKVSPVFAYPGGHYGLREQHAAAAAGYIGCVGVSSRLANYPWMNRFRLRRRKWNQ